MQKRRLTEESNHHPLSSATPLPYPPRHYHCSVASGTCGLLQQSAIKAKRKLLRTPFLDGRFSLGAYILDQRSKLHPAPLRAGIFPLLVWKFNFLISFRTVYFGLKMVQFDVIAACSQSVPLPNYPIDCQTRVPEAQKWSQIPVSRRHGRTPEFLPVGWRLTAPAN